MLVTCHHTYQPTKQRKMSGVVYRPTRLVVTMVERIVLHRPHTNMLHKPSLEYLDRLPPEIYVYYFDMYNNIYNNIIIIIDVNFFIETLDKNYLVIADLRSSL